ncbi:hypothetical protein PG993_000695 [Apiospora rasikravindrae]|uniref:Uncharacterized protein n=1 Tax=Apiospora rasikravindrae TaxID=990691 RepID=A0ABR1U9B0_9PEZI
MSYIGDALTYITGLLASPFVATPSATAAPNQPAEEGTSYFPKTAYSSRRSSISSNSTQTSAVSAESSLPQPPALTRSYTGTNPLPPLARDFPAPTEDLDIATQLARMPLKRSLHDSLRRAATTEPRRARVDSPEIRARKLAAAKQDLLALAGRH